jgi:hypothetical protein
VHPVVHIFLATAQPKQLPLGLSEEWECRTQQQDVFDLGYKCYGEVELMIKCKTFLAVKNHGSGSQSNKTFLFCILFLFTSK